MKGKWETSIFDAEIVLDREFLRLTKMIANYSLQYGHSIQYLFHTVALLVTFGEVIGLISEKNKNATLLGLECSKEEQITRAVKL